MAAFPSSEMAPVGPGTNSRSEAVVLLLSLASRLVDSGVWSRHQRAALKELMANGDEQTLLVAERAVEQKRGIFAGPAALVSPQSQQQVEAFVDKLEALVFDRIGQFLEQVGYKIARTSLNGAEPKLTDTWLSAVVSGLRQARPLPAQGACCCLGSGAGLLAFACMFFGDFDTVIGVEENTELHRKAIGYHRTFEKDVRAFLDSSTPVPVELILMQMSPSSSEVLRHVRSADVVVIDGLRLSSPHAVAAACAEICRPGTMIISLGFALPESDFETLHEDTVITQDWGSSNLVVRVQRRVGAQSSTFFPASDMSPSVPIVQTHTPRKGQFRSAAAKFAANEADGHISSPIGNSLLSAKWKRPSSNSLPVGRSTSVDADEPEDMNVEVDGSDTTHVLKTPEMRHNRIPTHIEDEFSLDMGIEQPSSPIGASLMIRKRNSRNHQQGSSLLSVGGDDFGRAPPIKPSSPMGLALLKRKQLQREQRSLFEKETGVISSSLNGRNSPLRRLQSHPPTQESASSPIGNALRKRRTESANQRALQKSKSGGISPTFRNLDDEFVNPDSC